MRCVNTQCINVLRVNMLCVNVLRVNMLCCVLFEARQQEVCKCVVEEEVGPQLAWSWEGGRGERATVKILAQLVQIHTPEKCTHATDKKLDRNVSSRIFESLPMSQTITFVIQTYTVHTC